MCRNSYSVESTHVQHITHARARGRGKKIFCRSQFGDCLIGHQLFIAILSVRHGERASNAAKKKPSYQNSKVEKRGFFLFQSAHRNRNFYKMPVFPGESSEAWYYTQQGKNFRSALLRCVCCCFRLLPVKCQQHKEGEAFQSARGNPHRRTPKRHARPRL